MNFSTAQYSDEPWSEADQARFEKIPPETRKEYKLLPVTEQVILWWHVTDQPARATAARAGVAEATVGKYVTHQIPNSLSHLYPGLRGTGDVSWPGLKTAVFMATDPSGPQALALRELALTRYFPYCRSVLNHLDDIDPFPNRARRRDAVEAVRLLITGRTIATLSGSYPAAAEKYQRAWRLLRAHLQRLREGHPTDPRIAHLVGLVAHELANAYAMFGRDGDARDIANQSKFCYEKLSANPTAPLSVALGKVRAEVVHQQACAYVDYREDVELDFRQIEPLANLSPTITDYYGLAKSYHFRALCAWFRGDYTLALGHARESVRLSNLVDPLAFFHQGRPRITRSWFPGVDWLDFLMTSDFWWLFRDGIEYGKVWWQAISTATLADILTCLGDLGDYNAMSEARDVYETNRAIRRVADNTIGAQLVRPISSMASAVGQYEWLHFRSNSGASYTYDRHRVSKYVYASLDRAKNVGMLYCTILANIGIAQASEMVFMDPATAQRAYATASVLADESNNAALTSLTLERRFVPPQMLG